VIERNPGGIISSIDDEIKLPGPNDDRLLKTIDGNNKKFIKSYKKDFKKHNMFTISHFANKVTYNVEGFIEKNMDNVSGNMKSVF